LGFAVLLIAAMFTAAGCDTGGGGGGGGSTSSSTLTITNLGNWNGRYVLAIYDINNDFSLMGFAPGSNGNYSAVTMSQITGGSATLEIWRVDWTARPPALSPYTNSGTVTFDVELYASTASNANTIGSGRVQAIFSNGKATGTFMTF
jgi:urease alpha subunit